MNNCTDAGHCLCIPYAHSDTQTKMLHVLQFIGSRPKEARWQCKICPFAKQNTILSSVARIKQKMEE
eukprot:1152661-Pelagomonas_calceolata.AAC.1